MDYITAIICTIVICSCLKYFINLIWPKIPKGANILLDYITYINQKPFTKEEYEKSKLKDYDFKKYLINEPEEIEIVERPMLAFGSFIPFSNSQRFIYGIDYKVLLYTATLSKNYAVLIFLTVLFLPLIIKVKGTKSLINPEIL